MCGGANLTISAWVYATGQAVAVRMYMTPYPDPPNIEQIVQLGSWVQLTWTYTMPAAATQVTIGLLPQQEVSYAESFGLYVDDFYLISNETNC